MKKYYSSQDSNPQFHKCMSILLPTKLPVQLLNFPTFQHLYTLLQFTLVVFRDISIYSVALKPVTPSYCTSLLELKPSLILTLTLWMAQCSLLLIRSGPSQCNLLSIQNGPSQCKLLLIQSGPSQCNLLLIQSSTIKIETKISITGP